MSILVSARDRTATYGTALANTNTTACYTNSGQQATKGVNMHIGNESGGTIVALIYWYDSSATTEYFLHGFSIDDDRGEDHDLSGIRLDTSDQIRVKAAS